MFRGSQVGTITVGIGHRGIWHKQLNSKYSSVIVRFFYIYRDFINYYNMIYSYQRIKPKHFKYLLESTYVIRVDTADHSLQNIIINIAPITSVGV